MKVLNLRCAHGHRFEGWFSSNEAFDTQLASGLVECPMCGDITITKLLAAPRLNLGAHPKPSATLATPPLESSLEARWMGAVRAVMAQTEDVGERFAEEARKIHYGETSERGIRGRATPEQAAGLLDEGIAVLSLPVSPALKETLQ